MITPTALKDISFISVFTRYKYETARNELHTLHYYENVLCRYSPPISRYLKQLPNA